MSLTNSPGDPQAMRALAHPVRLAVLTFLQSNGPATATILSPHVGATPSVTSWHLRHLATYGLVIDAPADEVPGDRRHRWWKAVAGRTEAEPQPELDWLRVDTMASTTVRLTGDELAALAARIDDLLAPFADRGTDIPAGARAVRILRYYLPG